MAVPWRVMVWLTALVLLVKATLPFTWRVKVEEIVMPLATLGLAMVIPAIVALAPTVTTTPELMVTVSVVAGTPPPVQPDQVPAVAQLPVRAALQATSEARLQDLCSL